MEENTKKWLVYGGAGASIIALILYMKNKQGASAASGYAPGLGTGSAGTSSDPLAAAQLNSATQLAIAQGSQAIQLAGIQAQRDVAQTQVQGAVQVAGIQASASKTTAGIGALGQVLAGPQGSAGGEAIKGLFDLVKSGFSAIGKIVGIGKTDSPSTATLQTPEGYSSPGSSFISPYVYSPEGYLTALGLGGRNADYYIGNTGSGDSSWFGIGEGDPRFIGPISPYGDSPYNSYENAPDFIGPINPYTYEDSGFVGPPAPPSGSDSSTGYF